MTVLANVLRRPISIYELDPDGIRNNNNDDNESSLVSSCRQQQKIVCKGTFGMGLFDDPCSRIPNSAVLSSSGVVPVVIPSQKSDNANDVNANDANANAAVSATSSCYSWQLHILILNVGQNGSEKHACVLLPHSS